MPYLELLAVAMAAATWGSLWKGRRILFHNDCEPVVSACNKGTSKSPILMRLIRTLHYIAATHQFEFRLVHIAGVTNVLADALSRGEQDHFRSLSPSADPSATPVTPLPTPSW